MEQIKVSDNFFLTEFIDPVTFAELGEYSIHKIDKQLIDIAQYARVNTGLPCTINNWASGGQYKESGLRRPDTTTGAKKSAHKLGKAIDLKIKGMSGQQMYDWARKNATKLYQLGVRRIETPSLTPSWLHMDTKEHGKEGVILVIDLTKVVHEIRI